MEKIHITRLGSLVMDEQPVPPPYPIAWYPGRLAWRFDVSRSILRGKGALKNDDTPAARTRAATTSSDFFQSGYRPHQSGWLRAVHHADLSGAKSEISKSRETDAARGGQCHGDGAACGDTLVMPTRSDGLRRQNPLAETIYSKQGVNKAPKRC